MSVSSHFITIITRKHDPACNTDKRRCSRKSHEESGAGARAFSRLTYSHTKSACRPPALSPAVPSLQAPPSRRVSLGLKLITLILVTPLLAALATLPLSASASASTPPPPSQGQPSTPLVNTTSSISSLHLFEDDDAATPCGADAENLLARSPCLIITFL
ncbi:hypothetical protein C8R45DRAFT_1099663 [Mycena sanguinolenta]|nr:hypothetical protein C8R45DRAFT_1099663 [Mycena sanguinolenta]